MTITAKVICDSICKHSKIRITTLELEYPRFIHSEFMTHRVFSRNASSSRAIPIAKMIQAVINNPAMPIHWGKNQPGMQANEEHNALVSVPTDTGGCMDASPMNAWLIARDMAVQIAQAFEQAGYHKQIVNRILEPFTHIRVIVTATNFANFFALRDHEDAQPEIRELAVAMKKAIEESTPQLLGIGEWHLPYLDAEDITNIYEHLKENSITRHDPAQHQIWMMACAVSAARCARVSYLTHDGERPTLQKDLELYRHLVNANPPHMSPCEHQATPDIHDKHEGWHRLDLQANFSGWVQFRHLIHGESVPG